MNKGTIKTQHPITTLKCLLLILLTCTSGSVFSQEGRILGDLTFFAGNFVPRNYMACDGKLISISLNTQLYSLIGVTYGGDGSVNFALPNLNPPIDKMLYIIAARGDYPSRDGVMRIDGNSMIGEVMLFAGDFIPGGWKECNGQTLKITE